MSLLERQYISFFYISSVRAIKDVIWSASKYIIWSDVELCHLVGRQNMSFGGYSNPASKYAIWLGVEIFHFEYVIWSGVEKDHMVIFRYFGRRNESWA